MSTLVAGEDEVVFAALRDAFRAATGYGASVMVVTVTNACPRHSVAPTIKSSG
jgi:hypothetical protein